MLLQNVGSEKIENSRGIYKIVSNQRRYIHVYFTISSISKNFCHQIRYSEFKFHYVKN